jgi:hypothetical protein
MEDLIVISNPTLVGEKSYKLTREKSSPFACLPAKAGAK